MDSENPSRGEGERRRTSCSNLETNFLYLRLFSLLLFFYYLHMLLLSLHFTLLAIYCLHQSYLLVFLIQERRQLRTSALNLEEFREVLEPLIKVQLHFLF